MTKTRAVRASTATSALRQSQTSTLPNSRTPEVRKWKVATNPGSTDLWNFQTPAVPKLGPRELRNIRTSEGTKS